MKVEIDLLAGPNAHQATKADIQKNIEALRKAIDGKPLNVIDTTLLYDTLTILTGLQEKLPEFKN